jgi:hypothetical protein
MKKICFFLLLACLSHVGFSQSKIDSVLYKKLDTMFKEDQKWRWQYIKLNRKEKVDYDKETISRNMFKTDSLNQLEVKRIFSQYGYPGFSRVGEHGSVAFWALVQHCDDDVAFQKKVLVQMVKEVKRHNADPKHFALLQDRVLANEGKKQIYGTQVHFNIASQKNTPLPIQDSLNVDIRRKAIGLSSLKDYLKEMDALK